jgi:hypothetical protein
MTYAKAHHLSAPYWPKRTRPSQANKHQRGTHESSLSSRVRGLKGNMRGCCCSKTRECMHQPDAQQVALQQELNEQRVAGLQDEIAGASRQADKSERVLETYSNSPSGPRHRGCPQYR